MEIECKKVKFATKQYADEHIDKLIRRLPRYSYFCPHCKVWHLTKKNQGERKSESQEINRLKILIEKQKVEIGHLGKIIFELKKNIKIYGQPIRQWK